MRNKDNKKTGKQHSQYPENPSSDRFFRLYTPREFSRKCSRCEVYIDEDDTEHDCSDYGYFEDKPTVSI